MIAPAEEKPAEPAAAVEPVIAVSTETTIAEPQAGEEVAPAQAAAEPEATALVQPAAIVIGTPEEAGLEMVATRSSEAPAPAEQPVAPARRRRSDMKKASTTESATAEPLQLVETHVAAPAPVATPEPATDKPRTRRTKSVASESVTETSLVQIETRES